jgi:ferredoxin
MPAKMPEKMPDKMPTDVSDTMLKELGLSVNAPELILPWLDRFYEPVEIKIIAAIHQEPIDEEALQRAMDLSSDAVQRLYTRGVLCKNEQGKLIPADFHARYDIWATFEGFKDIPDKIREGLNRWELDHYINSHRAQVSQLKKTGKPDPSVVTPRYLLLHEAFEVLDQVERVYLWPCNCRSMINGCSKPVYTCLRFDNSQGQGFEISRNRAKDIVGRANKKGLMQSGELGWDTQGNLMGALCNCCPDCCFPHLLAKQTNAEKIWPLSRYIARWHEQNCSSCGLCAKRCPFQAFTHDKKKHDKKKAAKSERLEFRKDLCRGCGLCAVTCPAKAIEMEKINETER